MIHSSCRLLFHPIFLKAGWNQLFCYRVCLQTWHLAGVLTSTCKQQGRQLLREGHLLSRRKNEEVVIITGFGNSFLTWIRSRNIPPLLRLAFATLIDINPVTSERIGSSIRPIRFGSTQLESFRATSSWNNIKVNFHWINVNNFRVYYCYFPWANGKHWREPLADGK